MKTMLPLFALLLGLAVAACGGDSGGEPATDAVDGATDALADAATDAPGEVGGDAGPDGETDADEQADTDAEEGPDYAAKQAAVLEVSETERWTIPGLSAPAHVVRTEAHVPHVYAASREDLGRVLGFVVARDRFFVMDLQRRLAQGRISELLGDVGLESDLESRMTGMGIVTQRILDGLNDELAAYLDAYAAGINAYIAQVQAGELPPPSEVELAGPLLGMDEPAELLEPFDRRDVAGMITVIMYETTFESGDPGRAARAAQLDGLFEGAEFQDLRRAGAREDVWERLDPPFEALSMDAWPGQGDMATAAGALSRGAGAKAARGAPPLAAGSVMARSTARLDALADRLGRREMDNFGSNVWAVAGDRTTDGAALLAGDGHLPLYVPSLMYQVGMDTRVFGEGVGETQAGLLITSLPVLAVGTNGRVAWSQVNPVSDIVDWYREEIELDEDGRPVSSRFQGAWEPLERVEETYDVADVPALGSEGRTEVWDRYVTFDGRLVFDVEGTVLGADEEAPEGAYVMNLGGTRVIPGDTDDDGVVSAISFDYTAFDTEAYAESLFDFGRADDVFDMQEATKKVVGNLLFTGAADRDGRVLFTAYQGQPCRSYLPRDADGRWEAGADPTLLLDGTQYGGFTIPTNPDGTVDESQGEADPYRCVVPFDESPQVIDPERGFIFNANNQPAPIHEDGTLFDDPWYIGGPWSSVRGNTIATSLDEVLAADAADMDAMAELQANKDSRLGELFTPHLLDAVDAARAASEAEDPSGADVRLAEAYEGRAEALDEVAGRLSDWADRGYQADSGVETFYHQPDADDRADAVATMIFNAWLPRAIQGTFGDEGMGAAWRFSGSRARFKALHRFLVGRGEGNPGGLASWHEDTGESIFFDVRDTAALETSEEVLVGALVEALDYLAGPADGPGRGGFDTDDMDAWLWGLRHQTKFESVIADYLPADSAFGFIVNQFSITTETLPLVDEFTGGDDPRAGLEWFPRGGDNYGVDAASPGFSGTDFTHGSGPVMRMVIALDHDGVRGQNIVPGGQSGLTDSPYFADQAAKWLANETIPLRFSVEQVLEGATGREVYEPAE